jgi:hypothetical protein
VKAKATQETDSVQIINFTVQRICHSQRIQSLPQQHSYDETSAANFTAFFITRLQQAIGRDGK